MKFADLRLAEPILRSVQSEGYVTATPIQARAIPLVLEGRDVLGCAQTGTGKTAAFALPILHRLSTTPRVGRGVRCLVLCPTRELATQTADAFDVYGKHLNLRSAIVFGGVGQRQQAQALRQGVDVLVATPGRLLDLLNQNLADLRAVEVLVLDEADRMLDMGFINDIRKIVAKLPAQRQTLLFSATMPREIRSLADSLLRNPSSIEVAPVASTADKVEQSVYFVERGNKPALLAHLYNELPMARTIVFTRTKHGADRLTVRLREKGVHAEAIHGGKTQNARERALHNFKINRTPMLIATDIASRGIDVDGITHVVNYDLTHEPETYVHRIGRTARAGATGMAVSFCDAEEVDNLRAIEKLIRMPIPVEASHAYRSESVASAANRRGGGGAGGHAPRHPHAAASPRPRPPERRAPSDAGHGAGRGGASAGPAHAPRHPQHAAKPAQVAHSPSPAARVAAPLRHPLASEGPRGGATRRHVAHRSGAPAGRKGAARRP